MRARTLREREPNQNVEHTKKATRKRERERERGRTHQRHVMTCSHFGSWLRLLHRPFLCALHKVVLGRPIRAGQCFLSAGDCVGCAPNWSAFALPRFLWTLSVLWRGTSRVWLASWQRWRAWTLRAPVLRTMAPKTKAKAKGKSRNWAATIAASAARRARTSAATAASALASLVQVQHEIELHPSVVFLARLRQM